VILNNVNILGERNADIEIDEGVIVNIAAAGSLQSEIDCQGLTLLPGLVDLHTHMREPGFEESETVASASRAGARGGFTALHAMPNTSPVGDTAGVVEQVFHLGQAAGLCDVFPIGAVTKNLEGKQLAELGAMAESEARVRIFSDDGKCVSDPLLMRRALEYVKAFGGVIAQHAQDPLLTVGSQMNESELSSRLGLKGWPAVAEEAIIARDVLLAQHVKGKLHICHVSTRGSVEIIQRAKENGINVTAEVTPHHLLLTEDLVENYDPIFKVNPPLRSRDDVLALREGVQMGVIDIIATDHAPHPLESKDCEWEVAAFGMLGLETALSVAYTALVKDGSMSIGQLADVLSTRPAAIGQIAQHGRPITVGEPANFVLFDTSRSYRVDKYDSFSKSTNNPYDTMTLHGKVVMTMLRGNITYRDVEAKL
jgi:dihydroorotase